LPFCEVLPAKQSELDVAPATLVHVEPLLVLSCHCIAGAGVPLAVELKQTLPPSQTVESFGSDDTTGGVLIVSLPAAEFAEPQLLVKTAR